MSLENAVPLARMFRKKSQKGTTYFTGCAGGARILLFKNDRAEIEPGGDEEWSLLLTPADDKQSGNGTARRSGIGSKNSSAAARDHQRPLDQGDDAVTGHLDR